MKRLILVALLCLPILAYAAAPTNNSAHQSDASQAVSTQHTATAWTTIADSMIVTKTDTCNTYYMLQGSVILNEGQTLFLGFRDGDAGLYSDTVAYGYPEGAMGPITIKFGHIYFDSLRSQTDAADTIVAVASVRGTGMGESVTLTNCYLTGTVIDYDAP